MYDVKMLMKFNTANGKVKLSYETTLPFVPQKGMEFAVINESLTIQSIVWVDKEQHFVCESYIEYFNENTIKEFIDEGWEKIKV